MEVSGGGGAVSIKISRQGEFKDLKLDPEFLKEDPEFVSEAILQAVVDAAEQAKKKSDDAMGSLTSGVQCPASSKNFHSLTPQYQALVQTLKRLPDWVIDPQKKLPFIYWWRIHLPVPY